MRLWGRGRRATVCVNAESAFTQAVFLLDVVAVFTNFTELLNQNVQLCVPRLLHTFKSQNIELDVFSGVVQLFQEDSKVYAGQMVSSACSGSSPGSPQLDILEHLPREWSKDQLPLAPLHLEEEQQNLSCIAEFASPSLKNYTFKSSFS